MSPGGAGMAGGATESCSLGRAVPGAGRDCQGGMGTAAPSQLPALSAALRAGVGPVPP